MKLMHSLLVLATILGGDAASWFGSSRTIGVVPTRMGFEPIDTRSVKTTPFKGKKSVVIDKKSRSAKHIPAREQKSMASKAKNLVPKAKEWIRNHEVTAMAVVAAIAAATRIAFEHVLEGGGLEAFLWGCMGAAV